ncbi:armadillo repeat-containing protein 2-like isoform X1 [Penaeus chinensis]|uniref:armadillo repeat-containing protein 2-like isoform X1 n=1 Tax=Penaeus chinensis TaxID=139456 RepID=UPI001FB5C388|nr:armadillo repeat-containing protein 2-like isoform X1 [Penaeus chinensis]
MLSQAVDRRRDIVGQDLLTPFYAPPDRKTSAQIIREARNAITIGDAGMGVQRMGVRTVQTKRPFTPRERERTLFSSSAGTTRGERPPSSFTLSPLHFDSNDTTGRASASGPRLQPLATIATIKTEDGEGNKLPSLVSSRRVQRHQFRALSLCDLPEEAEDNDDGGKMPRRSSVPMPQRSATLTTMSSLQESQEEDDGSHNSSPSPESRPDDVKKVRLAANSESITSTPLFQQLLNNTDLEVSDLESSLRLRREFQSPTTASAQENKNKEAGKTKETAAEQQQTDDSKAPEPIIKNHAPKPTPRLRKSESAQRKKSVSKRAGVDRDWRHAVEGRSQQNSQTAEDAQAEEKDMTAQTPANREVAVDQTVYYEEKINPILDEISRAVGCAVGEDVLAELVGKLYGALEAGGLLGRHFRYRSQVLRAVFRLVDREHGALLANIARVMLALKVSGSNLTSVCKLVFKVTRHDANDALFLEGNLLDLLLEAVACVPPLEQPEACVYGYGALKFLTMNSQLVTRLLNRGVLELLVLHMKLIVNHQQESGSVPEQTHYALVQLTGTLRHVSSCERTFPLLLVTGAVPQVCNLLQHFSHDADVTANVVRILSIISTHEECCAAAAAHPGTLPATVSALRRHASSPAIVVRLAYALGNMMANSDDARWQLFSEDGFTETLLELLTEYLRRDRHHQAEEMADPLTPASGAPEDVMVKLIRVLANVSVHARVGPVLARSRTCLSLLISVLRHKAVDESEELVLSALATLNNLTFYTRDQPVSALHTQLAECLCDMLPMDHVEGLVETIRVFGNLTHFREIRDIVTKRADPAMKGSRFSGCHVLEILIEMLDCDSRELVYVCAGVLVNLMSDASRRSIFQEENGVLRMIDVLQYFGYGDWQLCSLACQVLWNFCASAADVQSTLGDKETEKLVFVLEEFLDDDSYFNNPEVFGECDPETKDVVYQLWEDFAQVATKLLDRIEENTSSLPIVSPT